MREFYKNELERLKQEYERTPDNQTRKKNDLADLLIKFQKLINWSKDDK